MNSLHKNLKFLRLLNIKAFNSLKECTPLAIKQIPEPNLLSVPKIKSVTFSPRTIGVEIADNKYEPKIKEDPIFYIPIINPRSILPLIENEWSRDEIGLPTLQKEKVEAARLIVIRKRKMRKHKRKKLAKKMKYKWARIRQKRRQIKEKNFQAELLAMMKQAEDFTAEQYVAEKIEKANHTPLPSQWKKLPDFIIKQLMGSDKKINYRKFRHTDNYKV